MKIGFPGGKQGRRHPDAPKIFLEHIPSSGRRHTSGARRHRGPLRRLLGTLSFERRDVIIVTALLALLAAMLLRGYSDRLFDRFSGRPPSAVSAPDGGVLSPE